MKKKCSIVFVDNLEQVVVNQRNYFEMVLGNIKKTYSNELSSLSIKSNNDQLHITIDEYEFTFTHEIVILSKNFSEKKINSEIKRIEKSIDSAVKTLFVVDFCLDSPKNIQLITGIEFASRLCESKKNLNMEVAFCTGVPSYDRVNQFIGEKTLYVFHRALTSDNEFAADEFIFEESRYKDELIKLSTDKNNELIFLLDLLISNPFQNTQYLGDLLMSAFLFCEGRINHES